MLGGTGLEPSAPEAVVPVPHGEYRQILDLGWGMAGVRDCHHGSLGDSRLHAAMLQGPREEELRAPWARSELPTPWSNHPKGG